MRHGRLIGLVDTALDLTNRDALIAAYQDLPVRDEYQGLSLKEADKTSCSARPGLPTEPGKAPRASARGGA